jgi:hypothetical protein
VSGGVSCQAVCRVRWCVVSGGGVSCQAVVCREFIRRTFKTCNIIYSLHSPKLKVKNICSLCEILGYHVGESEDCFIMTYMGYNFAHNH